MIDMTSERKLNPIQKYNRLNDVFATDQVGPGGANHAYVIKGGGMGDTPYCHVEIQFQKGPRNDPNSIAGVLEGDLLEIVRDRLKAFQAGDFACDENAEALKYVELALMFMNRRAEERASRNVLGTMNK